MEWSVKGAGRRNRPRQLQYGQQHPQVQAGQGMRWVCPGCGTSNGALVAECRNSECRHLAPKKVLSYINACGGQGSGRQPNGSGQHASQSSQAGGKGGKKGNGTFDPAAAGKGRRRGRWGGSSAPAEVPPAGKSKGAGKGGGDTGKGPSRAPARVETEKPPGEAKATGQTRRNHALRDVSDSQLQVLIKDLRSAHARCSHDGALAKQMAKSLEMHEAELIFRQHEAQQPAQPESLAQQASKLAAQLRAASKKLRNLESQMVRYQEQLESLQAKMATAKESVQRLSSRISDLREQRAELPAEPGPASGGSGPPGPGPDTDTDQVFYDRVLGLLRTEGREAGSWETIIDRVQQLQAEATLARQTAAADAAAAEEERRMLRSGIRGRPVFSARHSRSLVTYNLASDDDIGPRDTADEFGSAAEMDIVPEESASELDSCVSSGRERAAPKRARQTAQGSGLGGTVLRQYG